MGNPNQGNFIRQEDRKTGDGKPEEKKGEEKKTETQKYCNSCSYWGKERFRNGVVSGPNTRAGFVVDFSHQCNSVQIYEDVSVSPDGKVYTTKEYGCVHYQPLVAVSDEQSVK